MASLSAAWPACRGGRYLAFRTASFFFVASPRSAVSASCMAGVPLLPRDAVMYLAVTVHFMLNKIPGGMIARTGFISTRYWQRHPDMDGDVTGGPGICCAWRALCHLRRIPDCPGRGLHQCIRFSPYLSRPVQRRASAAPDADRQFRWAANCADITSAVNRCGCCQRRGGSSSMT